MQKLLTSNAPLQLTPCNCFECQAMQKQGYLFLSGDLWETDRLSRAVSKVLKRNVIFYNGRWLEVKGLAI